MILTWLGHAQLFINAAGSSMLVDPWFCDEQWKRWPASPYADASLLPRPEFMCLTAAREDRASERTLATISKEAVICVPPNVGQELHSTLDRLGFTRRLVLPWHQRVSLTSGLEVEALPGPHGAAVMVVADGCTVLLGGTAPMPPRPAGQQVDLALVPLDGPSPGSLSADTGLAAFQAALAAWKPREAAPYGNGWVGAALAPDLALAQTMAFAHQLGTHLVRMAPGDEWSPDTGPIAKQHDAGGWRASLKHERTLA